MAIFPRRCSHLISCRINQIPDAKPIGGVLDSIGVESQGRYLNIWLAATIERANAETGSDDRSKLFFCKSLEAITLLFQS